MDIQERLFELQDREYAEFHRKLIPGVMPESVIGIRVPVLRGLAREIVKEGNYSPFLIDLPHEYYDENMLHGLIISELKDYDSCIGELDRFLPYVDNWAVCDSMKPRCFKKNRDRLLLKISEWMERDRTYDRRFGIEMLMTHFLDEDFKPEYLEMTASVKTEEYYLRMMIAWYFATALAKQWDAALPYIENGVLDEWVHNKTIQKAVESYRITPEQKKYLKTLKK